MPLNKEMKLYLIGKKKEKEKEKQTLKKQQHKKRKYKCITNTIPYPQGTK